jgi:tetratricopeptide (TPR) repeat protein
MTAPDPRLLLVLLLTGGVSTAAYLQPRLASWEGAQRREGSVLQILLGDGRRLFANHFFLKADAYFHRGAYHGVFDPPTDAAEELHMAHGGAEHHETHAPDQEPPQAAHARADPSLDKRDWIGWLNARLGPDAHVHLEGGGEERELLPWLRLSAELDPHRVQTYTVAAFWLRTRLGKVAEAEQFLWEGLRQNPGNPEILGELGQLYARNRQDPRRARNVWELALRRWNEQAAAGAQPDEFLRLQLLGNLAQLERNEGRLPRAIQYLEALRSLSPNPAAVEAQIRDLKTQLPH